MANCYPLPVFRPVDDGYLVTRRAWFAGSCIELDGDHFRVLYGRAIQSVHLQRAHVVLRLCRQSPEVIVSRIILTGVARGMRDELVPVAVHQHLSPIDRTAGLGPDDAHLRNANACTVC